MITYSTISTRIMVSGYIVVQMSVSKDYTVCSVGEDRTIGYAEYEVDSWYGISVREVADNAEEILMMSAELDDYGKLCA